MPINGLGALGLLRISFALVLRVGGKRAQGTTPAGEVFARRNHGRGRYPFFGPVHQRTEKIKIVERQAAAAVTLQSNPGIMYSSDQLHLLAEPGL